MERTKEWHRQRRPYSAALLTVMNVWRTLTLMLTLTFNLSHYCHAYALRVKKAPRLRA